jgi:hypothetical protein
MLRWPPVRFSLALILASCLGFVVLAQDASSPLSPSKKPSKSQTPPKRQSPPVDTPKKIAAFLTVTQESRSGSFMLPSSVATIGADVTISRGDQTQPLLLTGQLAISNFLETINANPLGVHGSLKTTPNGTQVTIAAAPKTSALPFSVVGTITDPSSDKFSAFANTPGLSFKLAAPLAAPHASLTLSDGTTVELSSDMPVGNPAAQWFMKPEDPPIALLAITHYEDTQVCSQATANDDPADPHCLEQYVIVRIPATPTTPTAIFGMQILNQHLVIDKAIFSDPDSAFAVNGIEIDPDRGPFAFAYGPDAWRIEWRRRSNRCRAIPGNPHDVAAVTVQAPRTASTANETIRLNGIVVGSAKLYDANTLRRMLSDTAAQLAAISGFSAAPITAAYGTLQGISVDRSYLAAQVTTTPLPTTVTTAGTNLGGTSSLSTAAPTTSSTQTGVVLQCPDGSLPSFGSGVSFGCSVPTTPSSPGAGSSGTQTSNTNVASGSTSTQQSGTTTSTQNGTQVTSGGFAGSVPVAPTATTLTPPSNVSESSADLLVDQVQLNAQITTLRLLLQGALSDQYLLRNSRAVAARQQATIGFNVSLDPPRQFRHAVAEVRIVLAPQTGQPSVSIMSLLPAEKTYNVAKVTSRQDSFGAGVALVPISAGVSTGRSKDRLYLAKDTDTLALQYMQPLPEYRQSGRPWLERGHDVVKGIQDFLRPGELGDCVLPGDADPDGLQRIASNSIVFGWQFRPVLGADYVKGGQRQVFAQLALPVGLSEADFRPSIYIQTRWRQYDPQSQVVGAVYRSSCSAITDSGGVTLVSKPVVRNVDFKDLGSGQVQITAAGEFYSSTLSVLEGSAVISPVVFDGSTIEVFGNAHDLLEADGLTLVGSSGQGVPLNIRTDDSLAELKSCGIQSSQLTAIPAADGNSIMQLSLHLGPSYQLDSEHGDGEPQILVLIGAQVFGLKETPFTEEKCDRDNFTNQAVCSYRFVAPTTVARNAQTFLASDVRWDNLRTKGKIEFYPMLAGLSAVSAIGDSTAQSGGSPQALTPKGQLPVKPPVVPVKTASTPAKATVTTYSISGFDFDKINTEAPAAECSLVNVCLDLYIGSDHLARDRYDMSLDSKTSGMLRLKDGVDPSVKAIRFLLRGAQQINESFVAWDLSIPKADASAMSVAPPFVHVSDSRKVTFGGDQVVPLDDQNVSFESCKLVAKLDASKKTLDVFVTTCVTKGEGHKELITIDKKSGKTVTLPVEVIR